MAGSRHCPAPLSLLTRHSVLRWGRVEAGFIQRVGTRYLMKADHAYATRVPCQCSSRYRRGPSHWSIAWNKNLVLWYKQPAEIWTDALPVGNGRLGGMIFGGIATEQLQINEDTLWSGAPRDWNNPQAKSYLPEIRRLVLEKRLTTKLTPSAERCRDRTTSPTSHWGTSI